MPQILQFFVPGYLALKAYAWFWNRNIATSASVLASCVLSYISQTLFQTVLSFAGLQCEPHVFVIWQSMLCFGAGIAAGKFTTSKTGNYLSTKLVGRTFSDSCFSDAIDFRNTVSVRLHDKHSQRYYEGSLCGQDGTYIHLVHYYTSDDSLPSRYGLPQFHLLVPIDQVRVIEVLNTNEIEGEKHNTD